MTKNGGKKTDYNLDDQAIFRNTLFTANLQNILFVILA